MLKQFKTDEVLNDKNIPNHSRTSELLDTLTPSQTDEEFYDALEFSPQELARDLDQICLEINKRVDSKKVLSPKEAKSYLDLQLQRAERLQKQIDVTPTKALKRELAISTAIIVATSAITLASTPISIAAIPIITGALLMMGPDATELLAHSTLSKSNSDKVSSLLSVARPVLAVASLASGVFPLLRSGNWASSIKFGANCIFKLAGSMTGRCLASSELVEDKLHWALGDGYMYQAADIMMQASGSLVGGHVGGDVGGKTVDYAEKFILDTASEFSTMAQPIINPGSHSIDTSPSNPQFSTPHSTKIELDPTPSLQLLELKGGATTINPDLPRQHHPDSPLLHYYSPVDTKSREPNKAGILNHSVNTLVGVAHSVAQLVDKATDVICIKIPGADGAVISPSALPSPSPMVSTPQPQINQHNVFIGRHPDIADDILQAIHSSTGDMSITWDDVTQQMLNDLTGTLTITVDAPTPSPLGSGESPPSIPHLGPRDLEGLLRIDRVELEGIGLETISPMAFSGLVNLKQVRLNDNNLNSLPNNLFLNAPNVQELYLENNPSLTTLPDDLTILTPFMYYLRMDHNTPITVSEDFFHTLLGNSGLYINFGPDDFIQIGSEKIAFSEVAQFFQPFNEAETIYTFGTTTPALSSAIQQGTYNFDGLTDAQEKFLNIYFFPHLLPSPTPTPSITLSTPDVTHTINSIAATNTIPHTISPTNTIPLTQETVSSIALATNTPESEVEGFLNQLPGQLTVGIIGGVIGVCITVSCLALIIRCCKQRCHSSTKIQTFGLPMDAKRNTELLDVWPSKNGATVLPNPQHVDTVIDMAGTKQSYTLLQSEGHPGTQVLTNPTIIDDADPEQFLPYQTMVTAKPSPTPKSQSKPHVKTVQTESDTYVEIESEEYVEHEPGPISTSNPPTTSSDQSEFYENYNVETDGPPSALSEDYSNVDAIHSQQTGLPILPPKAPPTQTTSKQPTPRKISAQHQQMLQRYSRHPEFFKESDTTYDIPEEGPDTSTTQEDTDYYSHMASVSPDPTQEVYEVVEQPTEANPPPNETPPKSKKNPQAVAKKRADEVAQKQLGGTMPRKRKLTIGTLTAFYNAELDCSVKHGLAIARDALINKQKADKEPNSTTTTPDNIMIYSKEHIYETVMFDSEGHRTQNPLGEADSKNPPWYPKPPSHIQSAIPGTPPPKRPPLHQSRKVSVAVGPGHIAELTVTSEPGEKIKNSHIQHIQFFEATIEEGDYEPVNSPDQKNDISSPTPQQPHHRMRRSSSAIINSNGPLMEAKPVNGGFRLQHIVTDPSLELQQETPPQTQLPRRLKTQSEKSTSDRKRRQTHIHRKVSLRKIRSMAETELLQNPEFYSIMAQKVEEENTDSHSDHEESGRSNSREDDEKITAQLLEGLRRPSTTSLSDLTSSTTPQLSTHSQTSRKRRQLPRISSSRTSLAILANQTLPQITEDPLESQLAPVIEQSSPQTDSRTSKSQLHPITEQPTKKTEGRRLPVTPKKESIVKVDKTEGRRLPVTPKKESIVKVDKTEGRRLPVTPKKESIVKVDKEKLEEFRSNFKSTQNTLPKSSSGHTRSSSSSSSLPPHLHSSTSVKSTETGSETLPRPQRPKSMTKKPSPDKIASLTKHKSNTPPTNSSKDVDTATPLPKLTPAPIPENVPIKLPSRTEIVPPTDVFTPPVRKPSVYTAPFACPLPEPTQPTKLTKQPSFSSKPTSTVGLGQLRRQNSSHSTVNIYSRHSRLLSENESTS